MEIIYITNSRIPTEKAHGVQIMKMCEAFASQGVKLTLVVPWRFNSIKSNPFEYYGVKRNFQIKRLPTLDFLSLHLPFGFWFVSVTFAISSFFFLLFQKKNKVIYTRGETAFFWSKLLPKRFSLFWETHIKSKKFRMFRHVLKRSKGLVVINKKYYKDLSEIVNEEKIILAPDGVDIKMFEKTCSQNFKKENNLPENKKIVLYYGSDIEWKGTGVLREATKYLPEDYQVVFAGDTQKKGKEKVIFVGQQPYNKTACWMKMSDILVLTGNPKSEISRYYTSPLKMFEYMASGKPIVSIDLPSMREILSEEMTYFYVPDNPQNLARKIEEASLDQNKAQKAREVVEKYDWSERAKNILNFIQEK